MLNWLGPTAPFLRFEVIVPVCCQIENSGLLASDCIFPLLRATKSNRNNSGLCSVRVKEHIFGALSAGEPR